MRLFLAFKAFFKALQHPNKLLENKESSESSKEELSHLRLLALLQKEGRLIDFLKEDISGFSDAQIGSAVRKIHHDCSKVLEEYITMRPVFQEGEGSGVTVPQGYDGQAIKIIGSVKGFPPYRGILLHKGWRAHKLSLPEYTNMGDPSIVCPAEVEVKI